MEYIINLYEYKLIGIHWIVLYVISDKAIYFDSFGVNKCIPEWVKKFIRNKNIPTKIYKIQAYSYHT